MIQYIELKAAFLAITELIDHLNLMENLNGVINAENGNNLVIFALGLMAR
jgi:hypothetical protein